MNYKKNRMSRKR